MRTTEIAFLTLLALVALERALEAAISRRNAAWSRRRGGLEHGAGHFPVMVAAHAWLLAGAALEVVLWRRPFAPALGATMLLLVLGAQGLRWWSVRSLGPHWNTRVVVVPGMTRVRGGPYRWLRHPNYAAVVIEGLALPLVHGAWFVALTFTAVNAAVLAVRIRCEEAALRAAVRSSP